MLPAVLNSGFGMSLIGVCGACKKRAGCSSGVPVWVEAYSGYGRWAEYAVYLADVPATDSVQIPWMLVVIKLAVAVLPSGDDVLILGSMTLWEQLNVDIMEGLEARGKEERRGY